MNNFWLRLAVLAIAYPNIFTIDGNFLVGDERILTRITRLHEFNL